MSLPAAAERVAKALRDAGCTAEVREMPGSTRTAEDAAAQCGCETGAIVKSLIFRAGDAPVLVLTSGSNRVHEKRLGRQLDLRLTRADADWVRGVTGFAIGGIPPIGHASPMTVVMDQDLMAYPQVWAAAGTPRCVFPITPADLANLTEAQVLDVT
ncbi:MAG: YbaK/EbsC family protein [Pseudomonadota bacterium]